MRNIGMRFLRLKGFWFNRKEVFNLYKKQFKNIFIISCIEEKMEILKMVKSKGRNYKYGRKRNDKY